MGVTVVELSALLHGKLEGPGFSTVLNDLSIL